jgi:hypothetical protein
LSTAAVRRANEASAAAPPASSIQADDAIRGVPGKHDHDDRADQQWRLGDEIGG